MEKHGVEIEEDCYDGNSSYFFRARAKNSSNELYDGYLFISSI